MYTLEVGKPYNPNRRQWPEAAQYNYRAGGHELVLFYNQPDSKEVTDIKNGVSQFAITPKEDVIFFCYKFGDAKWSDAPFSIHLVPEAERSLPSVLTDTEVMLLTTILVDASNGIVKAIRVQSLSNNFSQTLHRLIREQAAKPFPGHEAYDQIIAVYCARNDSRQIARQAVARCTGGATSVH